MTGIHFRNPSENSPYLLAGFIFLSWLFFNIFIFFILGKIGFVLRYASYFSIVIFGAFGLFTIIVLIAYLIAKKYKAFFLTIVLLMVVSIATSIPIHLTQVN